MPSPFPTTQWTEFFALRDSDADGRRLALSYLYERYWAPLYAYLRRRGFDQDRSADLLQSYFAYLLDRDVLARLDLSGRLRAFLIATLKNHVADQLDRERALKRSPGQQLLSLDFASAEKEYLEIPASEETPEQIYERRWAAEMVQRAQRRLEKREVQAGRSEAFAHLREYVWGGGAEAKYHEVAELLGASEGAIKVRVHRLRKLLGRLLREDIALTVEDPAAVDDELRFLIQLLE